MRADRSPATALGSALGDDSPRPTRVLAGLCVASAAIAILLALRDQPTSLVDDAAITFRYAARIAGGDGFTYNDGDRTNGASAPLYTLILALGHRLGADLEAFARSLGVVCYAATVALVTAVLARSRGLAAGAVGGVVLLTSAVYRTEALTGMESGFAAMLGMLVIYLVMEGRVTWAGVVLGLAIANKVDAGFLALAVGGASWLVLRRPPWRLAAVAGATAAPWFLFSLLYFGSVLPFSATQKLSGEVTNPSIGYEPLWILRRIAADRMGVLLLGGFVLALLVVVRVVRLERRASLAALSCAIWVLLHGAAFSLIDLGDPYPWYTTVLFPPLVVVGVMSVFVLAERLSAAADALSGRGTRVSRSSLKRALTVVLVGVVLASVEPGIVKASRVLRDGHETTDYEQFEMTRRQAGQFVGTHAEPGEVVQSCFGWIAFETLENPFRETCPLSTQIDPGPPTWIVDIEFGGGQPGEPPAGYELLKTFDSPAGKSFVYRLPD